MNIYFLIILLILYKSSYLSFNASNILNNPYNYRYKLCSGNGEPTYNSETNKVSCKCKERYTNEPEKKLEKYLNGNLIQCSYEKKVDLLLFFWHYAFRLALIFYIWVDGVFLQLFFV